MEILAKAVGRRKEAVAQVQIIKGTGQFLINNKPANEYLQNNSCSLISVKSPFEVVQSNTQIHDVSGANRTLAVNQIDTIVKVKGGGLIGQSDAIKLGIARAICNLNNSNLWVKEKDIKSLQKEDKETTNNNTSSETMTSAVPTLVKESDVKKQLKLKGLLTQDSRIIERKKYGLRKARKAPQYHKR
uniref:Small ribosomal subunit protein uS9c n=1 Tax=Lobochlamys culleus TaxID=51693 RepID=A0A0S2IE69_9CHLO|nr:ribosomal protein S9 [Lobochlamys culleus]